VGAPSDEKLVSFNLPFAEIAFKLSLNVPNVKQRREPGGGALAMTPLPENRTPVGKQSCTMEPAIESRDQRSEDFFAN